jgi:hypothetical protein
VGYRWWTGDCDGEYTVQTVFVDDGCAVLNGSAEMQCRAAFVWSLWAFIYGTHINIHTDSAGRVTPSKTAVSGVRYLPVPGRRHALRASPHYKTPEAGPAPDRARTVHWPRTGGRSGSGVLRGARGQPGPRTGGTPGSEGSGVTSGEPPEGRTGGTPGSEGSGVTSGEPSEGGLRSAVGSGATSGGLRRGSGSGVEPRSASGGGGSGVRRAPEPPPGGGGGRQAPE